MKQKIAGLLMAGMLMMGGLTGCGADTSQPDDYATNEGYEIASSETTVKSEDGNGTESSVSDGISKEKIKVGVLYISDPAEGSGYSYTHDLGILGMQSNLELKDEQIERKIVDDNDAKATKTAIEECIGDGCNVIFTTSWGYMETTSELAEKYPDVYFSHGTGYLSNGKNFNNYFGRIYQPRYLSGIVAGMNTKSNKIGYVAAMDTSNSEVTGGIDAFAIGVASVNPDAKIYVVVTNSWYDPEKEEAASKKLLDMGCDVMEGTWTGENYYGGMAEGLVEVTDLASFCAEGTQEKVSQAREAILNGSNNIFDGELKTNTGQVVGTAGGTLDDATITGGIDWYYENVVVVE